jgi:serine protease Do
MVHAIVFFLSATMTGGWIPQDRQAAGDVFTRSSAAVVTIRTATSQGSGVVVDPSGVVVTNLHTVRGEATATITLSNGDAYDDVRVIDVDVRRDLALLKIKAYKLPSVELGDSDTLAVGAKVFAIGSPRGLAASISEGLISALRGSGEGRFPRAAAAAACSTSRDVSSRSRRSPCKVART